MGVVDDAGVLVERYEYEPYGSRTVYFSPGVNDPDCYAPTLRSRRWKTSGGGTAVTGQPWGLNPIGHQSKMHDEVTGLIMYPARPYSPRLGRWLVRDPLGYRDGLNAYAAYYVLHGGLDPSGLALVAFDGTGNDPNQTDHGVSAVTNVRKLYDVSNDPNRIYMAGVGSDSRPENKTLGGATG